MEIKEIMKEIEGNWNYERCVKPEHVDYLIEQVEQFKQLKESIHIITTVRKSVYESHEQVRLIKKAVNDLK